MPERENSCLWSILTSRNHPAAQVFSDAEARVSLVELLRQSIFGGRREELSGCSVLLAVKDQLTAALALIELDGTARRITLCPADLPAEQLSAVARNAAADVVVCSDDAPETAVAGVDHMIRCSNRLFASADLHGQALCQTEWILLTSGTTGLPKLVVHTLASLTAPIKPILCDDNPMVWGTFYDIRRYGGLQIFLRAVLTGSSLVLSSAEESTGDFLARARTCGVTHISGTPSHWRRALMSPQSRAIAPRYVRLSGEIADQAILDHLHSAFPNAGIGHAFASTEAGVGFEVNDGFAGFPASFLGAQDAEVELKIVDGSLRLRSSRIARGYLRGADKKFADPDGFVDTGDMIESRGERCYFVGRADGTINVGGRKVHPEEVEAIIDYHPSVQMSLVKGRRSPITGAVVVADVVLERPQGTFEDMDWLAEVKQEIIERCRAALAPHKVPAAVRFVPSLTVTPSGKLARFDA
jgi:acyl-coenzyme A synthetase/AMP-(fatty) acid ligase